MKEKSIDNIIYVSKLQCSLCVVHIVQKLGSYDDW